LGGGGAKATGKSLWGRRRWEWGMKERQANPLCGNRICIDSQGLISTNEISIKTRNWKMERLKCPHWKAEKRSLLQRIVTVNVKIVCKKKYHNLIWRMIMRFSIIAN
jgi:hypothetical protein